MNETRKKSNVDIFAIWGAVVILVTTGLIMIYSASAARFIGSEAYGFDSMHLLKRQGIFVVAGLLVCFLFQYVNYSFLYRLAILAYGIGIGLILLLKTPLGVNVKGATRWLNLMGIQFQVAEFVKICVIIMMAYMVQRHSKNLNKLKLTIYMWELGGGAAVLLLLISNDLSSSLVVLGMTFCITFIYTKNEWLHYIMLGGGVLAAGGYILSIKNNMPTAEELEDMSFRVGRIAAWADPERYASKQGYQTLQSLYAIGSGGFWGKGLGNSTQKISAIPEAQNDMIFSIICEELGVFGAALIVFLIGYLCWKIAITSKSASNLFGSVLATGVLTHIFLQSFFNIGVNANLLPNTGIGLPFISYGGTAVFCQLIEIALVLSVGRVANGEKTINLNRLRKKARKR